MHQSNFKRIIAFILSLTMVFQIVLPVMADENIESIIPEVKEEKVEVQEDKGEVIPDETVPESNGEGEENSQDGNENSQGVEPETPAKDENEQAEEVTNNIEEPKTNTEETNQTKVENTETETETDKDTEEEKDEEKKDETPVTTDKTEEDNKTEVPEIPEEPSETNEELEEINDEPIPGDVAKNENEINSNEENVNNNQENTSAKTDADSDEDELIKGKLEQNTEIVEAPMMMMFALNRGASQKDTSWAVKVTKPRLLGTNHEFYPNLYDCTAEIDCVANHRNGCSSTYQYFTSHNFPEQSGCATETVECTRCYETKTYTERECEFPARTKCIEETVSCSRCGEEYTYPAIEHTYSKNNGIEKIDDTNHGIYCDLCNGGYNEVEHTYNDKRSNASRDCKYHTYLCDYCDNEVVEEHSFNGNGNNSTCTVCGVKRKNAKHNYEIDKNGKITYDYHTLKCTGCGDKKTEKHEFDNGDDESEICDCGCSQLVVYIDWFNTAYHRYIVNKDDCTETVHCLATETSECSEPNLTFNNDEHDFKYSNINADTHDCDCTFCNFTKTEPHDYDEKTGKCICGKDKPVCTHDYEYVSISDTQHKGTCKNCSKTRTEDHNLTNEVIPATCELEGSSTTSCLICGYEDIDKINALGHDWTAWKLKTAPTCTTEGENERSCQRDGCGEKEIQRIAPTTHDYETNFTIDTAATCTVAGSKSKHCTRTGCSATTEVTEIPATGHSYGDWIEDTAATCEGNGTKHRVCSVCNNVENENKDALGHDYAADFTIDTEATCTVVGSESRHCSRCEKVTEVTEIPATGHSYGEWIEDTAATCEGSGEKHRVCSVCNNVENENTDALGHDYAADFTIDTEVTCTVAGSKSKHCSRCEKVTEVTVIDALGHELTEWSQTLAPTCTQKGSEEQHCTRNNCNYSDTREIQVLGHNFATEFTVDLKGRIATNGSKSKHCTRSGCDEKSEITVIPASGLTFTNDTVKYNNADRELKVSGNIPDGVIVNYVYKLNGEIVPSMKNVGVYNVTAEINGGVFYENEELGATLTIENGTLDVNDYTELFTDKKVTFDGNEKSIELSSLPEGFEVDYSNNTRTNVGSQEATATLSKENYDNIVLHATLTVEPATITGVTFTDGKKYYDGTVQRLEVEGTQAGDTVTYKYNNKVLSDTEVLNEGSYSVKAVVKRENYNDLELNATLKIENGTITEDYTSLFTSKEETYDKTEKSIVLSSLPEGFGVKYSNNKLTNVGSVNATATLSKANYNDIVLNATLKINPIEVTVSGITAYGKTYNGTKQTTNLNISNANITNVLNADKDHVQLDITNVTATFDSEDAGERTATVNGTFKLKGNMAGNYTIVNAPTSVTGIIEKKSINPLLKSNITKVYNGTDTIDVEYDFMNGDIVNNDDVKATGVAKYSDKNVGTGKHIAGTTFVLSGIDKDNYKILNNYGTSRNDGIITVKGIDVEDIVIENKTYDGSTTATVKSYTLDGVVSGDVVDIQIGTATFADKNVGENKEVTISNITLTGTDKDNYNINNNSYTSSANITQLDVKPYLQLGSKIVEYDGNNHAYGIGVKQEVSDILKNEILETVTYKYSLLDETGRNTIRNNLVREDLKNVGRYRISADVVSTNMTGYISAQLRIIEPITVGNKTVKYNGEEHYIEALNLPEGFTASYSTKQGSNTFGETPIKYVEIGEYNTYVKVRANGFRYNGEGFKIIPVTLTIEKGIISDEEVKDAFKDLTVTYDGNVKTLLVDETKIPQGVTVKYSNNTRTNVGSQEATATLSKAKYEDKVLKATLKIEPATITGVTLTGAIKYYDGNVQRLNVVGAETTDTVIYTYDDKTLTDTEVLSVGSYSVKAVVKRANYNDLELNATLKIEKGTLNANDYNSIFQNVSVTYDGDMHSVVIKDEDIPEGFTVDYSPNSSTNVISAKASATLKNSNYNDLVLYAYLIISPKQIEVDFTQVGDIEKTFDGNNKAMFTNGTDKVDNIIVTADGVKDRKIDVTVTGTYDNIYVGDRKVTLNAVITPSTENNNASNYTLKVNNTEVDGKINAIQLTDGTFENITLNRGLRDITTIKGLISDKVKENHTEFTNATIEGLQIEELITVDNNVGYGALTPATVVINGYIMNGEEKNIVITKTIKGNVIYRRNSSSNNNRNDNTTVIDDDDTPLGLGQDFEFIDLPKNQPTTSDWAKDEVYSLVDKGVISGYEDSTYRPNNAIRRDEFSRLASVVLDLKENPNGNSKDFEDTVDNWAKELIRIATTNEVLAGYNDKIFGPADNITNEQMMAILIRGLRYLKLGEDVDTNEEIAEQFNKIADGDKVSEWAKYDAATSIKYGLFVGDENKAVKPLGYTTRAQVAVILEKYIALIKELNTNN